MAQSSGRDRQRRVDLLKKEKEALEAERAKLEAEKALAATHKALDQEEAPSTQHLNELQMAKALADAQKELVDSRRALQQSQGPSGQRLTELQTQRSLADAERELANAQTQTTLARQLDDVKAGPYSGTVNMREGAGAEEALLLAARAIKEGAARIARAVNDVEPRPERLYLFGARELPNFQELTTFRLRKELLKQAFEAAGVRPTAGPEALITPGMASERLEAFSRLLGFFKTDYEIGGIQVELDESLLIYSVAGGLAAREVHLPLIYEPNASAGAVASLAGEMSELMRLRGQAGRMAAGGRGSIAGGEGMEAVDPRNGQARGTLPAAAGIEPGTDPLTGVMALFDSFVSSLVSPDAGTGSVPLATLARELAIEAALKDGAAVLLLRLENTGGGYLLKRNLLTGLGAMPLYHMGGATVGYLLLSGPDGRVLAGDVYPIHGGFVRTDRIRAALG